jgi:TRAP-type C4-dicarboxylate transport system permease small subunit
MDQLDETASKSNTVVTGISKWLCIVGAVALFVMMITGVIDVLGRYLFLRPLQGANEIVSATLVIAATVGLGYAQLAKAHIRVTIVNDKVPPKTRAVLEAITCIVCAGGSAMITWQGYLRLVQDYMFNPRGLTEILAFPWWPFMLVFVIGFAWFVIILLVDFVKAVKEVIKR